MRAITRVTLLAVCLSALGSSLSAAEPNAEHAKLLGNWQAKWVEVNGEQKPPEDKAAQTMQFTAEHIAINEEKLPYKLDTETSPRLIDIEIKIQDNPVTLEGIYKLENDQFTICLYLGLDGTTKRPDDFTTAKGSNRIMVMLERAK